MKIQKDLKGTLFNTELNDICRKYFIKGQLQPTQKEVMDFPSKYNEMRATLFESFILNKEVNFKVAGQNIPLCVLLNEIGLKGVEELIEEKSLSFTLWAPMILYTEENLKGINPLVAGRHDNGIYIDPEESIISGLGFMRSPLKRREARTLTRKLRDCYLSVPKGIENDSVSITMSALESGKLKKLGLSIDNKDSFSKTDKELLTKCADDLLGYKFLIQNHSKTSPSSNIRLLLGDSLQKSYCLSNEKIYSEIITLEKYPDLRRTFHNMGYPMEEIMRVRKSRSAKKFREWLMCLENISDPKDIHKSYIDSIQSPKGFFETFLGKTTKSVSMMLLSAYAGSHIEPSVGKYIGAFAGRIAEPATDYILDMADEYLFGEITKGWTPKIFLEDINAISFKYSI